VRLVEAHHADLVELRDRNCRMRGATAHPDADPDERPFKVPINDKGPDLVNIFHLLINEPNYKSSVHQCRYIIARLY
jgi:hypothetical protein